MTETTQDGTDVVERIAAKLLGNVNAPEGAIYRVAREIYEEEITRLNEECRLSMGEIARLRSENERLREALTDIGVYGCGMLNQPIALNGPNEAWLEKRIAQYERVARAALSKALGEGQDSND